MAARRKLIIIQCWPLHKNYSLYCIKDSFNFQLILHLILALSRTILSASFDSSSTSSLLSSLLLTPPCWSSVPLACEFLELLLLLTLALDLQHVDPNLSRTLRQPFGNKTSRVRESST